VQALNNAGSSLASLLLIAKQLCEELANEIQALNNAYRSLATFSLCQVLLINKSVPQGLGQSNAWIEQYRQVIGQTPFIDKLCRLLIGQTPFLRCSCLRMDSVPLGFLLIDGNFREGLIGFAGGKDAFTSFTKANKTVPTG